MNYAMPVVVSHGNEDFRAYLRDMLTKHGFFHVIETSNSSELESFISRDEDVFALIEAEQATREILTILKSKHHGYLFITQPDSEKTTSLAIEIGVNNLMSFPFSSQTLIEKISRN